MASTQGKILVIDDDRDVLETAKMFLKQYFETDICDDPSQILRLISRKSYDVILLDMNFRKGRNDGEEGFYWLRNILDFDGDALVILITAYGEIDLAVKAIKMGAMDFVLKPWKNQKLLGTVMAGFRHRRSRREVKRLKDTNRHLDQNETRTSILGTSKTMHKLFALIEKVSKADANVLILGENGTGKELVARAIHDRSHRADKNFIKVDLGAVTPTLFESELFGHEKGAFTDAKEARGGSFEIASGGTLFLDEISNLEIGLQTKLLTALESRKIRRVGSNKELDIDIRLVTASNRSLKDMVATGDFREDLLYRINTVEIVVPPLRERKEDVPMLVNHYLAHFGKKYDKPTYEISSSTLRELQEYRWPGNVRELKHSVERAVILSESEAYNDVSLFIKKSSGGDLKITGDINNEKPRTLEAMERLFIIYTLDENGGNVTQTAKTLGLTRTALYRRLKKYGI